MSKKLTGKRMHAVFQDVINKKHIIAKRKTGNPRIMYYSVREGFWIEFFSSSDFHNSNCRIPFHWSMTREKFLAIFNEED